MAAGPAEQSAAARGRLVTLALALALLLAGAWAYANSLGGVLVLDDIRAIVRNPTIRALNPIAGPLSPPTGTTVAGRPAANLSFALNYATAPAASREAFDPGHTAEAEVRRAFLENIRGYRLTNLAIHLLAGLVLFGVVRRTLDSPRLRPRFETSAAWLAAAVALVWLVHPLQTASVSYLVQRVESLMGLAYLLAVYSVIRAGEPGRSVAWAGGAVLAGVLGMASKEVMVTAPIAAWLWVRVFGSDADARRRRPALAGLAATWVVLAWLVAGEQRAPSLGLDASTAWRYLITQAAVIVHYVRLALLPSPLVFLYSWPLAASVADVLPQALAVVAALGLTAYGLTRRHPLGFAGAWFFLVLAPTSSILPIVTEVAAEHRMYLPLAAIAACFVLGLDWAVARIPGRADASEAGTTALLRWAVTGGVVLLLAGALTTATRARNLDYTSAERLWGRTVAVQPDNPRARVAYGEALARAGRLAEAEAQYGATLRMAPPDVVTLVRLGTVQAAAGRIDDAVATLERALALDATDPDAHRALARLHVQRGDLPSAVTHFEAVLARYPDDEDVIRALSALLANAVDPMVRNPQRAVALAERAVSLTGREDGAALDLLAVALARSGRMPEALATTREALVVARRQGDTGLAANLERRLAVVEGSGAPAVQP